MDIEEVSGLQVAAGISLLNPEVEQSLALIGKLSVVDELMAHEYESFSNSMDIVLNFFEPVVDVHNMNYVYAHLARVMWDLDPCCVLDSSICRLHTPMQVIIPAAVIRMIGALCLVLILD